MKGILHLLLTALSLIARPTFNFACCADRHVFPLSQSKLESRENATLAKSKIKYAPGHAYGSTEHALISNFFWCRQD